MGIDIFTLIAQLINLFVLVWLLKHFLYQPVLQIIEKRRKEIEAENQSSALLTKEINEAHQKLEKEKKTFETSMQEQTEELTKELSDKNLSNYPMWPGVLITPSGDREDVTLSATYLLKVPLPIIGTRYLPVNQKVTARKWIGYTGGSGQSDNKGDVVVYVTADSDVYHMTTECTHLKLSVTSVSGTGLALTRSNDGGKYTRCQICKPPPGLLIYYIAKEGNRYHMTTSCSGLKRSYYTRLLSEVQGILRPCSRCGK